MAAMSNALEAILINYIFRSETTFTKPAGLWIALCTDATADGQNGSTITEVVNDYAYSRLAVGPDDLVWSDTDGSNGTTENLDDFEWATASGGNWGTVSHIAIVTSGTHGAGDVYFHGALAASKVINDGDTMRLKAGDITVQIDN